MTNGDKIRAMTDEELAKWLAEHSKCLDTCPAFIICAAWTKDECKKSFMKWLKQESEETE